MKNKFFAIFFLIITATNSLSAFCAENISSKLKEIEKTYYGYTYSDSTESRLQRLEKNVYGLPNPNPGLSQSARAEKLYRDLLLDTSDSVNSYIPQAQDIGPQADSGIKYPMVDKLEERTFQKTYQNEDIYARIARLEKQVFPHKLKESTRSLSERVDALRDKILGGTNSVDVDINPETEEIILENGKKYYGDYSAKYSNFDDTDKSHYNYYSYENSKNRISPTQPVYDYNSSAGYDSDIGNSTQSYGQSYDLDILEKSLLGKRYVSETPSKRLARLETKVFSRTFNDDEEARIQRLLAVTTAQKTSHEYDSNKWARRLNAGLQIGGILLMVLAMIL